MKDNSLPQYHPSLDSLYKAADDGCYICDLITNTSCSSAVTDCSIETEPRRSGPAAGGAQLTIIVSYKGAPPMIKRIWADLYGLPTDFSVRYDRQTLAQSSTGNHEVLSLAKRWLTTCQSEHEDCRFSEDSDWYPTRLLRLHSGRASLVDTRNEAVEGQYATLSHCWGTKAFQNLTTETFFRFQNGVLIAEFPLSFRHAMETCLLLDIHLIWIDCFCIIQGHDEVAQADWEVESAKMLRVYANGCLNIAAAWAKDPMTAALHCVVHECRRLSSVATLFRNQKRKFSHLQKMSTQRRCIIVRLMLLSMKDSGPEAGSFKNSFPAGGSFNLA